MWGASGSRRRRRARERVDRGDHGDRAQPSALPGASGPPVHGLTGTCCSVSTLVSGRSRRDPPPSCSRDAARGLFGTEIGTSVSRRVSNRLPISRTGQSATTALEGALAQGRVLATGTGLDRNTDRNNETRGCSGRADRREGHACCGRSARRGASDCNHPQLFDRYGPDGIPPGPSCSTTEKTTWQQGSSWRSVH